MQTKPLTLLLYGGIVDARRNKGDALMLLTVISRLRKVLPEAELVARRGTGSYIDRSQLGLYQQLFSGPRFSVRRLTSWIMSRHKIEYGLRTENDLSAVLNFQGYRFADFGADEVRRDYNEFRHRQRRGVPYIYLPQAYGPFERPEVRRRVCEMLNAAALVYARDSISADYLREAGVEPSKVMQSPDMTIGFPDEALLGELAPSDRKTAYVIPNRWMLSRAGMQDAEAIRMYTAAIARLQERCAKAGVRVFFMDHSPLQDGPVIHAINSHLQRPLEVVQESDPFKLKALVGSALFVFGSRYHSLVAALSQNVPAIGTSWAPKYQGLFSDYEVGEWLLGADDFNDRFDHLLDSLFDDARYRSLALALSERNKVLKARVASMWESVRQTLSAERSPR